MKNNVIACLVMLMAAVGASAQDSSRLFELKSGVITRESIVEGQRLETKLYFDDYGRRFAEYVTLHCYIDGELKEVLVNGLFCSNGHLYSIEYAKKAKTELTEPPVNFLNITEDMKKTYRIKKIGKEEMCGKPCDVYSLRGKGIMSQSKTTAWVWKGITMKKDVRVLNIYYEETANDIQENVHVDPSVFIVPEF